MRLFSLAFMMLSSVCVFPEETKNLDMRINRRMMEDKTLIGFQGSACLPMEIYNSKIVQTAFGGGLRGKYFGTNGFAFGFDFSFFSPKINETHVAGITDSMRNELREEQRIGKIKDTSAQILNVTANAQYIPINLSFEFYLPSHKMKKFRPYAAVGIGLNLVNRRYNANFSSPKTTELSLFEGRYQRSANRGFVSINPSIGFLYTIDELWNINVDLRYNSLLAKPFISSGALSLHIGIILDIGFKYVR